MEFLRLFRFCRQRFKFYTRRAATECFLSREIVMPRGSIVFKPEEASRIPMFAVSIDTGNPVL